jgi:lipopolysaccharide transport system ATP-binding protein
MSNPPISIRISGLSKTYRVWRNPQNRFRFLIRQLMVALFPSLRGHLQDWAGSRSSEFNALVGINFEVKKGTSVGIMGRNGSGKSTLLQIIAGTVPPSEGEVELSGRVAALLELGSGFNPDFTGLENVRLNAAILGMSSGDIEARLDEILQFADIGAFIHQPVRTYSSGMALRLAFSVQCALDPDVLIVDEALAVGDEAFQRKCLSRIEALKKKGTTILFVSHSAQDVIKFCDEALVLESGRMIFRGVPHDAVKIYQGFIHGSRKMQLEILTAPERFLQQPKDVEQPPQPASQSANLAPGELWTSDLVSFSKVAYEPAGAEIVSVELENSERCRVNHIVRGNSYRFQISVRFDEPYSLIAAGVIVTDKSGIEIAGASSWETPNRWISVKPGDSVCFTFPFECRLNPGTYFLRIGIASRDHGFLHRIIDAKVFRVVADGFMFPTGLVDLRFGFAVDRIIENTTK